MTGKCIFEEKEYLFIYPEIYNKNSNAFLLLVDYKSGWSIRHKIESTKILDFDTSDYIGRTGYFVYSNEVEIIKIKKHKRKRLCF